MKKLSAQRVYESRWATFCKEAKRGTKKYSTVREAWAKCQHPAWMRWWLFHYVKAVSIRELQQRFYKSVDDCTTLFTDLDSDPALCNRIRAHYSYTGRKRKPKRVT